MTTYVQILQGISGSGKSHYIKKEIERLKQFDIDNFNQQSEFVVFSADSYFINEHGDYEFNAAKLPAAHKKCLTDFIETAQNCEYSDRHALNANDIYIFIDNTNLTVFEYAPYFAIANSFGFDVQLIRINCSVDVAAKRNIHGLTEEIILKQQSKLDKCDIPPWIKFNIVGA